MKRTILKETIVSKPLTVKYQKGDYLDLSALDKIGKYFSMFKVVKGGKLKLYLTDVAIKVPNWSRLVVLAGGEVEIYDANNLVGPGQLIHGDYGTKCLIRNAVFNAPLFGYGGYIGNWMLKLDPATKKYVPSRPGDVRNMDIDGFHVRFGSVGGPRRKDGGQAGLRFMGAFGIAKNVKVDNTNNDQGNEGIQLRHGNMVLENSESTSFSVGRLNPRGNDGAPYKAMPHASVMFKNVKSRGYIMLTGDPHFAGEGITFPQRDPRKIGGDVAITNKQFGGCPSAKVALLNCKSGAFKSLGFPNATSLTSEFKKIAAAARTW